MLHGEEKIFIDKENEILPLAHITRDWSVLTMFTTPLPKKISLLFNITLIYDSQDPDKELG